MGWSRWEAMLAVTLAALSALSYGASDFSGAVATKSNNAVLVTAFVQTVSLGSLIVVLAYHPDGTFLLVDLAWGALGGLGASVGLVTFYQALARGPMSVAAALTALWSSAIPVLAGLGLGDRPGTLTLVGIALAVPSAVLVSVERDEVPASAFGPRDRVVQWARQAQTRHLAVVAGLGFSLFYIALSRTSADGGLYPLIGARLASIGALGIILTGTGGWAPVGRRWWPTIGIAGLLDCAANATYLVAVRHGSLAWVAAISSLYPVSTVLLARVVLSERLGRVQLYGLGGAGLALILVGVGA